MDRGAWWATAHGVAKSRTRLSDLMPRTSLLTQTIKDLPVVQEIQIRFLGWEDPLEEETAANTSIPAWRIPWTGSLAGYRPWDRRVGQD